MFCKVDISVSYNFVELLNAEKCKNDSNVVCRKKNFGSFLDGLPDNIEENLVLPILEKFANNCIAYN